MTLFADVVVHVLYSKLHGNTVDWKTFYDNSLVFHKKSIKK